MLLLLLRCLQMMTTLKMMKRRTKGRLAALMVRMALRRVAGAAARKHLSNRTRKGMSLMKRLLQRHHNSRSKVGAAVAVVPCTGFGQGRGAAGMQRGLCTPGQ
jgi:hypothetical protein